jgi:hypothetical protein
MLTTAPYLAPRLKARGGGDCRFFQRPTHPAPLLSIPVLQSTSSSLFILLAHLSDLNGAGYHNLYSPHDETYWPQAMGVFEHSVGARAYSIAGLVAVRASRLCSDRYCSPRYSAHSGDKKKLCITPPRDFTARCVISIGLTLRLTR